MTDTPQPTRQIIMEETWQLLVTYSVPAHLSDEEALALIAKGEATQLEMGDETVLRRDPYDLDPVDPDDPSYDYFHDDGPNYRDEPESGLFLVVTSAPGGFLFADDKDEEGTEGTEGQDRKHYTDDQDRKHYTTEE